MARLRHVAIEPGALDKEDAEWLARWAGRLRRLVGAPERERAILAGLQRAWETGPRRSP